MTTEQALLFALFGVVFVLLIWGRIRYDLVAFSALVVAVTAGLVSTEAAFSGFGHPAVVIIALVLIVSRALANSGAIELVAARIVSAERPASLHIAIMSGAGAILSAVINNVAALALLMPLDVEAAERAKRAVTQSLMPLSFATILGGMITLIGTPPNIVIAQYREQALGAPFGMFDFAPVGLAVATAGIAFVALIGWRLLPKRQGGDGLFQDMTEATYVAELTVTATSRVEGLRLEGLDPLAEEKDVNLLGLIRDGTRLSGFSRWQVIKEGDVLVVEGQPKSIEAFKGGAELEFGSTEPHEGGVTGGGLTLMEAIVPDNARIAGRSAIQLGLLRRQGVGLIGVSRAGRQFRDRVRQLTLRPGDVLL